MNPANPALTAAASATAPAAPVAAPEPSVVGEQALTQISTFNSRVTDLVRSLFPDLTRGERALVVGSVLSVVIVVAAGLLSALCSRLQSTVMRAVLRAGIGIAALVGLVCVWVPGVLGWFETEAGARIGGSALTIFIAIIVAALMWEAANRFLFNYYLEQAGARSHRLRTLLPLFRRFILVFLFVVTALTVMTELGINIAPLLAGAGIIGIAIGFGAQKLAQDFITGLFIVLEDAIALGDIVTIEQHSGVVEDITLRTLRLRDGDGAVHILPFSNVQTILNRSKGDAFAMVDIGIGYESDLLTVERLIRAVMESIKLDPEYRDILVEDVELMGIERLDPSAMIYRFRQACPSPKQFGLKREMLRRTVAAFNAAGIDIPMPTVRQLTRDAQPASAGVEKPSITAGPATDPAPTLPKPPATPAG